MKNIFIIKFLILFNSIGIFSQTSRDQDLITLFSGYQYLGYIIEQEPGKHIKLYRPVKNDTVTIKMEDIEIMNKITVQAISDKKSTKDGLIDKYNYKRNSHQFSFMLASNFWEYYFMKGFSYSYYRNFSNKYYVGVSTSFLGDFKSQNTWYATEDTGQTYYSYNGGDYKFIVSTMLENKFRLFSWKPQQKRASLLAGVNLGYVMDFSKSYGYVKDDNTKKTLYTYEEDYKGAIAFGISLALKVNPDNNSGIIIEPGMMLYTPTVYVRKDYYNAPYDAPKFRGHHNGDNSFIFSTKISYFF